MNSITDENRAAALRVAIERLMTAKLLDALHPGGIQRLAAHRATGVASSVVRDAERQLELELSRLLPEKTPSRRPVVRVGRDRLL